MPITESQFQLPPASKPFVLASLNVYALASTFTGYSSTQMHMFISLHRVDHWKRSMLLNRSLQRTDSPPAELTR